MAKAPKELDGGGEKKRRGLFDNINARKRAGTSRPKSESTVSAKAYAAMRTGWGKKPKSK